MLYIAGGIVLGYVALELLGVALMLICRYIGWIAAAFIIAVIVWAVRG
jgi:hypothetical protein